MMLIMIIINNNKSLDRMEVDIAILVSDFSYSRGLNILATFLLQKKKKDLLRKCHKILHSAPSGLNLTVQPHLAKKKLVSQDECSPRHPQPHSDTPDVAATSAFSIASTQYQVTRRGVKGHTLELHMSQLGKSISLSEKQSHQCTRSLNTNNGNFMPLEFIRKKFPQKYLDAKW